MFLYRLVSVDFKAYAEEITVIKAFKFLCALSCQVKKDNNPPLSLYGQLLWREFFYATATNNPCFDKMEGNPMCVQIPWDRNPEALAKWAEGRTGFPWIDAIMTQLRQEGWIHHLARHAVACFLTRGDLWLSWEEGMKVRTEEKGLGFLACTVYIVSFKRKVIVNKGTVHMVKNTNMHCLDCSLLSCRRLKSYLSMPTGV